MPGARGGQNLQAPTYADAVRNGAEFEEHLAMWARNFAALSTQDRLRVTRAGEERGREYVFDKLEEEAKKLAIATAKQRFNDIMAPSRQRQREPTEAKIKRLEEQLATEETALEEGRDGDLIDLYKELLANEVDYDWGEWARKVNLVMTSNAAREARKALVVMIKKEITPSLATKSARYLRKKAADGAVGARRRATYAVSRARDGASEARRRATYAVSRVRGDASALNSGASRGVVRAPEPGLKYYDNFFLSYDIKTVNIDHSKVTNVSPNLRLLESLGVYINTPNDYLTKKDISENTEIIAIDGEYRPDMIIKKINKESNEVKEWIISNKHHGNEADVYGSNNFYKIKSLPREALNKFRKVGDFYNPTTRQILRISIHNIPIKKDSLQIYNYQGEYDRLEFLTNIETTTKEENKISHDEYMYNIYSAYHYFNELKLGMYNGKKKSEIESKYKNIHYIINHFNEKEEEEEVDGVEGKSLKSIIVSLLDPTYDTSEQNKLNTLLEYYNKYKTDTGRYSAGVSDEAFRIARSKVGKLVMSRFQSGGSTKKIAKKTSNKDLTKSVKNIRKKNINRRKKDKKNKINDDILKLNITIKTN